MVPRNGEKFDNATLPGNYGPLHHQVFSKAVADWDAYPLDLLRHSFAVYKEYAGRDERIHAWRGILGTALLIREAMHAGPEGDFTKADELASSLDVMSALLDVYNVPAKPEIDEIFMLNVGENSVVLYAQNEDRGSIVLKLYVPPFSPRTNSIETMKQDVMRDIYGNPPKILGFGSHCVLMDFIPKDKRKL